MSDYLLESLEYNIRQIEDFSRKKDFIVQNNDKILKSMSNLENKIFELHECKNYYSIAVNEIYEKSIKSLKDTLDTALQFIIHDRDFTSRLLLEDRRGTKTLNISIIDNDEGEEIDLREGTGMGVATIISAILKIFYLLNKDSRILLLDEKYSAVSENYIEKFYDFLRSLCKTKGFTIVLISHDPRQIQYADYIYQISRGVVTKVNT